MKRLIALFVILLIAVMPAMAEFTPNVYHSSQLPQHTIKAFDNIHMDGKNKG